MTRTLSIVLCIAFFLGGLGTGLWLIPGPPPAAGGRSDGAAGDGSTGGRQHGDGTSEVSEAWDPTLGARPRFTDVTAQSGIAFRHENGLTGKYLYLEIMGAGVGLLDHDGDGDLDIYLVNGNRIDGDPDPSITNRLYRNDGDWRFTDVTAAAGVGDSSYGQGCCAGDYDNDGDPDLYVSNLGPNVLYRNNGDGTFTDVTASAGVGDAGWGQSSSFLDYDGDGRLDLYVQNYLVTSAAREGGSSIRVGSRTVLDYPSPLGYRGSPDRLYRNNGDGTFTDVTREAGVLQPDGKGMGIGCADFNGDGHADIFIANDTAENYLFVNRGDGTFTEAGLTMGVAFDHSGVPEASMGVDVGDYDRDGRLDMIVPCLRRQFYTLYRNAGDHFEDRSVPSGLARATSRYTGFNANFLDYDDDGDLDLFFTDGGVRMNEMAPPDASYNERYGLPDLLLANDGEGRFTDVSALAGSYFQRALIGRGSATGDLDGDGDIDLVVCNLADAPVLLRNDTEGGHWITLDLVTAEGARNPFGTTARIEAGELRLRAEIHAGVTYLSQSDRRIHFGLGDAARIERLEIRWPDGTTQELRDLPADRLTRIEKTPR